MSNQKHVTRQQSGWGKRRRKVRIHEERLLMFRWSLIILLVAFLLILAINYLPPLFSKFDIVDNTYAPRDVERQYHEVNRKLRGD